MTLPYSTGIEPIRRNLIPGATGKLGNASASLNWLFTPRTDDVVPAAAVDSNDATWYVLAEQAFTGPGGQVFARIDFVAIANTNNQQYWFVIRYSFDGGNNWNYFGNIGTNPKGQAATLVLPKDRAIPLAWSDVFRYRKHTYVIVQVVAYRDSGNPPPSQDVDIIGMQLKLQGNIVEA